MFTKDIIWSARNDYLHDLGDDYGRGMLWGDEELLRHLNTAVNEWSKETGCIKDSTTAAICKIPLLAGQLVYAMDQRILQIHNGWLASGWPRMVVKDEIWCDRNAYSWRTKGGDPRFIFPDYEAQKLCVIRFPLATKGYWSGAFTFTATSPAQTIAQTGALFSSLLAIGSQFVISGTQYNGTTAVPKTFTVATVGTDSLTTVEAITDETVTSGGIIQKVTDTMWMSVSRLPLAQVTLAGWETESPEIRFDYHPKLIDGILREAYSKQDSQCLDKQKAAEHGTKFEKNKTKAYNEINRLRYGPTVLTPNPGNL